MREQLCTPLLEACWSSVRIARPGHRRLKGAAASSVLSVPPFPRSSPRILVVGNVTVDVVNGVASPGGAVVYAAAVLKAWGLSACIVTAAADADAALEVFGGHDLHVVPSNATLTFEHSYTFWGAHRRLRVTRQPNVTLTWRHVPRRCRSPSLILLGPLMPEVCERGEESLWEGAVCWLGVCILLAFCWQAVR